MAPCKPARRVWYQFTIRAGPHVKQSTCPCAGAMHFGPPPPQPGQAPVFPIAPASGGVPAAAPAPGGGFAPPNPAPLFPIDQASGGVPAAAPAPGGGFAPQNPAPLFPIGSAPAPAFMPPTAAAGEAAAPQQLYR